MSDYSPNPVFRRLSDERPLWALVAALRQLGARHRPARRLARRMLRAAQDYVHSGPFEVERDTTVAADLARLRDAARQAAEAITRLGISAELRMYLRIWDAGACEAEEALSALLVHRHGLSALAAIADAEARAFKPHTGAQRNEAAHFLVRTCATYWFLACGRWPSQSKVDGFATAPLVRLVRALVYAIDEEENATLRAPLQAEKIWLEAFKEAKAAFGRPGYQADAWVITPDPVAQPPRRGMTRKRG